MKNLAAVVLALSAFPAAAQPKCGPHDAIVARLADGYGETRQAIGITSGGGLLELFASATTSTWTITITAPSGVTCVIAVGAAFDTVADIAPALGDEM